MHADSETFSVPRLSLIARAADHIRKNISDGVWSAVLPSERHLCDLLQISRPTLRRALDMLRQKGLFRQEKGAQRVIKPSAVRRPGSQSAGSQEVVILCPPALAARPPSTHYYLIERVHLALQKARIRLVIESPAWLDYKDPTPYLARHVHARNAACWALLAVNKPVQSWFSSHAIPALVSGSCYPGVSLPSVDFDYAAVARHAVKAFRRKGYRNIALIAPEHLRQGDAVTMEAFLEAIGQAHQGSSECRILRAPQDPKKLDARLASLLQPDHFPQALFVIGPLNALYITTWLLQRGCKFKSEVALITREEDYFYGHMAMRPASYTMNKETFAARFCRTLLKLAQSGACPPAPVLITPDFVEGDTF